jgi:DNA-binding Lrp family transcriptional regulator
VTVSARVDPQSLGIEVFAFAFLSATEPARHVASRIAEIDEAVFVVCTAGRWNLIVEIRCRDHRHFQEVLDRVRAVDGVADLETLTAIDYLKAGTSGIAAEVFGQQVPRSLPSPVPGDRPLDEVDHSLVGALVQDGRATFADLAPVASLSQAGARARVQRLLHEDVVKIHATASARALGLASFSALLVSVPGPAAPVLEDLCTRPEFTVVAPTSGRFDAICEVWCRDNEHFFDTLDGIRTLDGIFDVQTATYLEIVKERHRL